MGKAQVSIVTYSDYPTLFGQIGVFCAKHAANDLIALLVTVTSRATLLVILNSLKTFQSSHCKANYAQQRRSSRDIN